MERAGNIEIVRAAGPLALEELLIDALRAHQATLSCDPRLLATPVCIVVPSRALREHLVAVLPRRVGGALAAVRVVTHFALAREVLERAGQSVPRGARIVPLLVRRAAQRQSLLEQHLPHESFDAGAIGATVNDILDAGFEAELGDACHEALASANLADSERSRAEALIQVANAVATELSARSLGRAGATLLAAAHGLSDSTHVLRAAQIWIHGFADATGAVEEFLASLAHAAPTRVFWDDAASAPRFGAGLRARFGIPLASSTPTSALVDAFQAQGIESEAREIVERVQSAIDAGVAPERIGIVSRDLARHRVVLRTHLARLGVAHQMPPTDAARGRLERRVLQLAEWLVRGESAEIDRWRDARASDDQGENDLRLALRALGIGRLRTLVDFDPDLRLGASRSFALPVRRSAVVEQDTDEETQVDDSNDDDRERAAPPTTRKIASAGARRRIDRALIEAARAEAQALCAARAAWPEEAPLARHIALAPSLLAHLGRASNDAATRSALESLAHEIPHDLVLTDDEFFAVWSAALVDAVVAPEVESHGGVRVLSVTDARAHTFERLFVFGLESGSFPRTVREDPLLSDDARRALRSVLEALPEKGAGREEERALFEQLLRAAPHVTLSWRAADDDGRAVAPSPLLDSAGITAPEKVALAPSVFAPRDAPRPAHEAAVISALSARHAGLGDVLDLALDEALPASSVARRDVRAAVRGRLSALADLDRAPHDPAGLGLFHGFVGARESSRRERDLPVTTLERMAACPWQTFLQRVLRVEPAPDPLVELPAFDPRLVGAVVHAVLATLAPVSEVALTTVIASAGSTPNWPTDVQLRVRARAAARHALDEAGVLLPGIDHLVATLALETLARARTVDAADPTLRVIAAEVEGVLACAAGRELTFRADRVERDADGLRLVDWKIGKPWGSSTELKQVATREKHVRNAIAQGRALQGFVYAVGAHARGRYVFLTDRISAHDARLFDVRHDDKVARKAFDTTSATLFEAWDRGVFFPRLTDTQGASENRACAQCEVSAACVRGDSGARARLVRSAMQPAGADDDDERTLRALWSLPDRKADEPEPKSKTRETGGDS